MRWFVSIMLVITIALVCVCYGEQEDGFYIGSGVYVVGEDIVNGRYDFYTVDEGDVMPQIWIFETKENYEAYNTLQNEGKIAEALLCIAHRYNFSVKDETLTISLIDGNVVTIGCKGKLLKIRQSISPFQP